MSIVVDPSLFSFTYPVSFKTTSFFQRQAQLPTPQEVRAATPDFLLSRNPNVATGIAFPNIQLYVKYGPCVRESEGQAPRIVSHYLSETVPTPEIFGWDKDGNDVFLYMQLVPGVTLGHRWATLSMEEKDSVCDEIKRMIGKLKMLKQPPSHSLIGKSIYFSSNCMYFFTYDTILVVTSIRASNNTSSKLICASGTVTNQPAADNYFYALKHGQVSGPFRTVKDFHDWFTSINLKGKLHSYRSWLPDIYDITFTHADIHRDNLIVTESGPPNVLAIVDWAQAGWYPDYWEICKARLISDLESDWYRIYIPRIFGTALDEWFPCFEFFFERIGPLF